MFDEDMWLFSCYYKTDGCCSLLNWCYVQKYFLKGINCTYKSKWFFSQSSLQAFKRFVCTCKEQKGHLDEEKQHCVSSFFFKTNLFKEWMNKFITLLTKEKQLKMKGKMMTLTFFELYASVLLKFIYIWTSS